MPIEFLAYRKGMSKDLLEPHREEINQLGFEFEDDVYKAIKDRNKERLFDTLDNYDFVIFAVEKDRIVGFATVRQRFGMDEWELDTAYVHLSYRRRGIWKKMTEMREQLVRNRGANSIVILPEQFLRNALTNMGFKAVPMEEDMRKTL